MQVSTDAVWNAPPHNKQLPAPFAVAHFGEARPCWGRAGNSRPLSDARSEAMEVLRAR